MGGAYAGATEPKPPSLPAQRARISELRGEIVGELEAMGAPVVAIHYVLTVLLPHSEMTWGMVAQRVRQAKERRGRIARQSADRPALKERCIAAYHAVCAYCDRAGALDLDPDGKPWNLDRIMPGSRGGEYEPSNVALACFACSQRKGAAITFRPPPSLAECELTHSRADPLGTDAVSHCLPVADGKSHNEVSP